MMDGKPGALLTAAVWKASGMMGTWKPGALLRVNGWSLGHRVRWPHSRLGISLWGPSDSGLGSWPASGWLLWLGYPGQPVLPNLDSDCCGWPESTGGGGR